MGVAYVITQYTTKKSHSHGSHTVTTSLMEAKVGTRLVTSSLAVWSHTAFGQSQAVTPVTALSMERIGVHDHPLSYILG